MIDPCEGHFAADDPVPAVARLRNYCSGSRVIRQDGNVGAVRVATPVPVKGVFAGRGINLEASDISLSVVVALC